MCSLPFVCVFHLLTNPLPFARALYVFRSSPFVTNQNTSYLNVFLLLHSEMIAELSTLYITTIASFYQSFTTFYYTLKLVQRTLCIYLMAFRSVYPPTNIIQHFVSESSAFWYKKSSTVLKASSVNDSTVIIYITNKQNILWNINNKMCPLYRFINRWIE